MNNLSNNLSAMQSLGFTLPSPAYLFGAIVFGLVGLVAWRYGKKTQRPATQWLGVALMFYPYAISQTWLLYVVGMALCAGLFYDRG
ncbi:hypothetical protein [Rhodoferax sediminis]|jgi:hypothetical protein|uniref:Amino acid transport protein n=1 Tax=Rhodoferax sediminis TaxID=2509614 RepID=A0A515D657_9BURK|nr:hypothetical protein [Rhodoferax sediminis]QDL35889.1 hypothetical protein EUB48_00245 [Rhodoferax sediminis]